MKDDDMYYYYATSWKRCINLAKAANHTSFGGWNSHDYYPNDEPFQYYNSTANSHHLPPISISMIGHTDQANYQYDLSTF